MNPKYERFLKPSEAKPKKSKASPSASSNETTSTDEVERAEIAPINTKGKSTSPKTSGETFELELFETMSGSTNPSTPTPISVEEEPSTLHAIFRKYGKEAWLKGDHPALRAQFNLINSTLHPDRPAARGVAVLVLKGTSFEDKRQSCLDVASELDLEEKDQTGEIELVPEPENPFDPYAVLVKDTLKSRAIGYIPKAAEVNKTYAEALADNKFCGGYILETRRSMLKEQRNAMIFVVTGWL
jgi:hypothetical protein